MRARLPDILVLFLAATVAAPAAAQCPTAADGFDLGGVAGTLHRVGTFDLGNGPELYVTGSFGSAAGGVVANSITRWDGGAWRALGSGLRYANGAEAHATRMIAFDDGSGTVLFVAGDFDRAGDVASTNVAAWNGQSWLARDGGLQGSVGDFAVFDDGNGPALWCAASPGDGTSRLHRWNGSAWVQALVVVAGHVSDLAAYDDGSGESLYLAGSFQAPSPAVARFDGTTLSGVGGGLTSSTAGPSDPGPLVRDLAVWDDGTGAALHVAGQWFDRAGTVPVSGIARWRAGQWSAVGTTLPFCGDLEPADLGNGEKLYAIANPPVPGVFSQLWAWNGGTWTPVASGPGTSWSGWPVALGTLDRGSGVELVVAGALLLDGSRSIASWDGQVWDGFGAAGQGLGTAAVDLLVADVGQGERLHALSRLGGLFDGSSSRRAGSWNGSAWQLLPDFQSVTTTRALASFDRGGGPTLITADGQALYELQSGGWLGWAAVGGPEVRDLLVVDLGNGPTLVVTGTFGGVETAFSPNVAAYANGAWLALGNGLGGPGYALAEFDDGTGAALYAGGSFTSHALAMWSGTVWQPVPGGPDGLVTALCVYDDGTGPGLYAGGDFTAAGGSAAPHVARWDGQAWSALGSGLASDHPTGAVTVADMVVFDDGSGPALWVGGDFHTAGGVPAANVARWDGTSWSALGAGASHRVTALEVFDDGAGEALFLAGEFVAFDGVPSAHIARWGDRCASEASVAFCEATDAACPCGNGGNGQGGCDTPQGTGGVRLELASFVPGAGTSEVATLRGSGFPASTSPAVILLRAGDWARDAAPFGDGLACLGGASAVADVRLASGGTTTHVVTEQDGTGVRYFQLRYRSNPAAFCDATAAFNTSNAFKVTW